MIKKTLNIINSLGLHARAAGRFVEITNRFDAEIYLAKDNMLTDAKSIMGIIAMGVHQGDVIDITVNGVDEQEAMKAVEELLAQGLEDMR